MAHRFLQVLTVVAALLASAAASAAPATLVPASFRGGEVYLKVRLNGAAPVWMRFDIGADDSSLASAYVQGDARKAARMTVALGSVTLPGIFFDLSKTAVSVAPDGLAVAGTLGQAWLGNRMMEVRYRQHEVWLSAPIDEAPRPVNVAAR